MHFTTTQTEHQLIIKPDKREAKRLLIRVLVSMLVGLVVMLILVEFFDVPAAFILAVIVLPLARLHKFVDALKTYFIDNTYAFDRNTRQFLAHNTEERSFEGIEAISLVYVDYMATKTIFLSLNYTNSWRYQIAKTTYQHAPVLEELGHKISQFTDIPIKESFQEEK